MWYGTGSEPEGTGALSCGVRYDYTFEAPEPPGTFTVADAQYFNHVRVRLSGGTAPYYYIYIGTREDGSDARFVSYGSPYSGPASSFRGRLDTDIDLEEAGITRSGTYYMFLKAAVTWWQGVGAEPPLTSALSAAVRYRYTRR